MGKTPTFTNVKHTYRYYLIFGFFVKLYLTSTCHSFYDILLSNFLVENNAINAYFL